MGFQLSPGVVTSEIDLTTVVPAVGTSTGAFAGVFTWGPIDFPVQIANENKLVEFFGKPNSPDNTAYSSNNAISFFTAANFLSYGNDLRVVRAGSSSTNTAVSNPAQTANASIKNDQEYFNNYYTGTNTTIGAWAARYPGAKGNSLRVDICANTGDFLTWTGNTLFSSAPATSSYAASVGAANDELHIVVVDADGAFTGTQNTVLETFGFVSKAINAKDSFGNSNYYRDVIYNKSKYIYSTAHPDTVNTVNNAGANAWGTVASAGKSFINIDGANPAVSIDLVRGTDGNPISANVINSYSKFVNAEEIDISLVLTGGYTTETGMLNVQRYVIDNIVETRKDCVAFISPPLANCQTSTPATDVASYRDGLGRSSSYAVMDSSWKYQYDKYNDVYRWIPSNGDIAGLCVRTDAERDPWWSPAGLTRGNIKNVVKLAYVPNKTDRDTLYKTGINPIVSFPGEGVMLYGDKTLLARPSAFDRINVRRLFIVLEKAIARAARSSLFEFNDEFTRAQFVSIVEPFLRDVKGRRGIYDYKVVCDETNNTGEVIDRNEFIGDIYIKPARSINFIQLNFVAVRTGVSFDEVVGKF